MSVEHYGKDKFRVRQLVHGERRTVRICNSRDEAEAFDRAFVGVAMEAGDTLIASLKTFGPEWLDKREKRGVVSIGDDRSRWRTHIETASFFSKPMVSISDDELVAWIDGLSTKAPVGALDGEQLSSEMIGKVIKLLRMCFDAAVPKHLDSNPLARVKKEIKDATRRRRTEFDDPWTWLEPQEQGAIRKCERIPEEAQLIIRFAILTGLRQGEQFNLMLQDVRDLDGSEPQIRVRKGSATRTTKGGKPRWVPLLPEAVKVLRRWLELLPSWCASNPLALVFPTRTGCRAHGRHVLYGPPHGGQRQRALRAERRKALELLSRVGSITVEDFGLAMWPSAPWEARRYYLFRRAGLVLQRLAHAQLATRQKGDGLVRWMITPEGRKTLLDRPEKWKRVDMFQVYLRHAGIIPEHRHDGRHVRWHDLRHTCGASLVSGWWGHRWSLEMVKGYLGHSSIKMTERYAHLADDALKKAARWLVFFVDEAALGLTKSKA